MDFYHGSSIMGLTELVPFLSSYSNLKEACVYLTTNKQLALHYIWNYEKLAIKSPMLDIRKDGLLVFQEMFSGALEYFYKGLSGCIYHCVGNYEISDRIGVADCAVSTTPVPIVDFEYIDDVYKKIVDFGEKGMFIYEKFEELPQYRHDIIRRLVLRSIKRDNLLNKPTHPSYKHYQEKYPEYWAKATQLAKNNKL